MNQVLEIDPDAAAIIAAAFVVIAPMMVGVVSPVLVEIPVVRVVLRPHIRAVVIMLIGAPAITTSVANNFAEAVLAVAAKAPTPKKAAIATAIRVLS